MNKKLISVDIFDTLITRRVILPHDLFLYQAEKAIESGIPIGDTEHWQKLRINAEKEAREKKHAEEISIDDIYLIIEKKIDLPIDQINELKKIEIDSEIKLCTRLESGINKVRKKIVRADKVIYLSDMYLPKKTIVDILTKNRLPKWDLFLSSDTGKMKHTGNAFLHIQKILNTKTDNLNHIGDNKHSDVKIPTKMGIQAEQFLLSTPSKYEYRVSNNQLMTDTLGKSLISAAMKIARNRIDTPSLPLRSSSWNIGCNILGPTAFFFTDWVINSCIKKGIKKIYFLARDGQLPFKMAKRIKQKYGYDIEIKYLYASRQSLHLPALTDLDENVFEWLLVNDGKLTLQRIMERLKIAQEDIPISLPYPLNHIISKNEITNIKLWLQKNEVKNKILKIAEKERALIKQYLLENDVLSGEEFAIVDIGWHGRLQASISKLLDMFSAIPPNGIHGFYLGLLANPKLPDWSKSHSFIFSSDSNNSSIKRNPEIYEIIFSADHESTASYFKSDNGKHLPVFKGISTLQNKKLIRDMQYGAISFLKQILYVDSRVKAVTHQGKIEIVKCILEDFFCRPKKDEIELISSIHFSSSQENNTEDKIISSSKKIDAVLIALNLKKAPRYFWFESEIALIYEGNTRKIFLKYIEIVKSITRKIKDRKIK